MAKFEHLIQLADKAGEDGDHRHALAAWEDAVRIYTGTLLPDCYEDWIFPKREALHDRYMLALAQCVHLLEAQRDLVGAMRYVKRLLEIDPLHEASRQDLMRLYATSGDRSAALRAYHSYADLLRRELGVEPALEIQEMYQRLLDVDDAAASGKHISRAASSTAARLIGRVPEWRELRRCWRIAHSGHPHFVLISGEPGAGKTRLAEELFTSLSQQGIVVARTRSYAAEGELPYAPVIDWLRSETIRVRYESLDAVWLTELARIMPDILSGHPALSPPEPNDARWNRHVLFEALANAMLADTQPRLLFIDDLQWCDIETLEWLRYLMHFDLAARLLIVGTARTDEVDAGHPLSTLRMQLRGDEQLTDIQITPLSDADTIALANQIAGHALDETAQARVLTATEGNPLFIVEMVRAGIHISPAGENAAQIATNRIEAAEKYKADLQSLPPKVQAVIQARLMAVSPQARRVASIAATIGRVFRFDILAAIAEDEIAGLPNALDELWRRGIVREHGDEGYDFSHDLIREAAYAEIALAWRQQLHMRIASVLASSMTGQSEAAYGRLAYHHERGGQVELAITNYMQAGKAALQIHANQEAATQLSRGISLMQGLPQTQSRMEQELDLQIALGVAQSAVLGIGATGAVYLRARQLCQQLQRSTDMTVLRGLASFYMVSGELSKAKQVCLELLDRAQEGNSTGNLVEAYLVEAHYALGTTLCWAGEFVRARQHHEAAILAHVFDHDMSHLTRFPHEPGAICRIWLALSYWFLGYPDQAEMIAQESISQAREIDHPLTTAYVWLWYAKLHELIGNPLVTLAYAERTIDLAEKHDFPLWITQGVVHRGWARAKLHSNYTAAEEIRTGMIAHGETGAKVPRSWHMTLLADALGELGQFDAALSMLDEALALGERSGICDCQAERLRLKGELLLQSHFDGRSPLHAAEDCFLRAIDMARTQEAKSLELRTSISLARYWHTMARTAQARELLNSCFDWFSEGFNTPDLQEATALLKELS